MEVTGRNGRDNAVVQSAYEYVDVVRPPRLRAGDQVRLVAPAGVAGPAAVTPVVRLLERLGLRVSVGAHVHAGSDEQRVEDVNEALRDTGVRALIAAPDCRGVHRVAGDLDFTAAAAFPKLLVGFGEHTILHLVLWERSGLAGVYGTPADDGFAAAALGTGPVRLSPRAGEPTAALTTTGRAAGVLLGGDHALVVTAGGWALPSLHGAILLLHGHGLRAADVDRQLTMLHRAGRLDGVRGVAVGRYVGEPADDATVLDVLRDRLALLGVPVLGGLPIGYDGARAAIPIGTRAVLDADGGTLLIESAVS